MGVAKEKKRKKKRNGSSEKFSKLLKVTCWPGFEPDWSGLPVLTLKPPRKGTAWQWGTRVQVFTAPL